MDKRIELAKAMGATEGDINRLLDERAALYGKLILEQEEITREDEISLRTATEKLAILEAQQEEYRKQRDALDEQLKTAKNLATAGE